MTVTCTTLCFALRALNTQIPRLDDKVKAADRILQRLRGSSETMAGLLGNLQRLLDGYIALSHTSTQVRGDTEAHLEILIWIRLPT